MLKYEFVKCMDLRAILCEKINGTIFVGKDEYGFHINIHGGPSVTCRINITDDLARSANLDQIADKVYWEYRKFIINRFFKN